MNTNNEHTDPRDQQIQDLTSKVAEMQLQMAQMTSLIATLTEANHSGGTRITRHSNPFQEARSPVHPLLNPVPNLVHPEPIPPVIPPANVFYDEDEDEEAEFEANRARFAEVQQNRVSHIVEEERGSQIGLENEVADHGDELRRLKLQVEEITKNKGAKPKTDWKSGYEAAERASIPHNLTMPNLEKFDGKHDPSVYLKMFVATMVPLRLGNETLIQIFPRYLTGAALRWYYQQDIGRILDLDHLATIFIERFGMHLMLEQPEKRLKSVRQRPNEIFRSYINRWKDVASEVDSLPEESKQVDMLVKGLNKQYSLLLGYKRFKSLNKLISVGHNFDDILSMPETETPSLNRFIKRLVKPDTNFVGNVWAAESSRSRVPESKRPVYTPRVQPPIPPSRGSGYRYPNSTPVDKATRKFDEFGIPLSTIFKRLCKREVLEALLPNPERPIMGKWIDQVCEYHQVKGHSTDTCYTLKNKIQDLIDAKIIPKPEVITNPLPKHEVNTVEIERRCFTSEQLASLIVNEEQISIITADGDKLKKGGKELLKSQSCNIVSQRVQNP